MTTESDIQPNLLDRGYKIYTSGQYLQSAVLLLFRLSYGWEMYLSGFRHLHNVDGMVSNFQDWGVPLPRFNVYVSGITEMIGGALLMLGLATRLVSVPLVFNFLVAIVTAGKTKVLQALLGGDHLRNYNEGHLGGLEAIVDDTAFPFLLTSLATLVFGAGKVSLDYVIYRFWYRRPKTTEQRGFAVGPVTDRRPIDS